MADVEVALQTSGILEQQNLSNLARRGIREYASKDLDRSREVNLTSLWPELVKSGLARNISERYLTAACNAISVYLNTLLKSPSEDLRSFATSRNVWREGFDCAQYAFACGRTKPALQVLETLTYSLNEYSDKHIASEILQETSEAIIATILTDEPRGSIKASCISLSCFLRKTELPLSLHIVCERALSRQSSPWQHRRDQAGVARENDALHFSSLQELLLALLFAVNNLETRSAALKLFTQICGSEMQAEPAPMTQAARVLEYYIRDNEGVLGDFANNVLPVILESKPNFEAFASIYAPAPGVASSKLYLYIAVLRVGRLKEYITEEELPIVLKNSLEAHTTMITNDSAVYRSFDLLLQAGDASIRLHTYNLLTASFATNASVPVGVLDCLRRNFRHSHDDNDAYDRGEIISTTRRFLKRLDNSYTSLKRLRQAEKASHYDLELIVAYEGFVEGLFESLDDELEMGVSYQRHIIALGTLQLLLNTSFDGWHDSPTLITRLVLLVIDAYDDVRVMASAVLASMQKQRPRNALELDQQLLTKVLALSAKTCRNDHADAAGRLMALLGPNECTVAGQEGTMEHCALNKTLTSQMVIQALHSHLSGLEGLKLNTMFPLHAYILALFHTYAVETISDDEAEAVLAICDKIWLLVQPELCIDSPETGTEESDDFNVGGPKDLLAYAWRALRDSSLLLQSVMRSNQRYLQHIGSLCIQELTMLRHRGAFSTVAQTFAVCCDEARSSEDYCVRRLLRQWYDIALAQIDAQASKVTRRSAGLPAMFNAILSPQDELLFQEAVRTLKHRAAQDVLPQYTQQAEQSLPQVHALNCIKDLITNSRFRAVTEQFVLEMIELAADRMSSSTWAIRNCGLMLIRACMNRLDPKMVNQRTSLEAGENAPVGPGNVALMLLKQAEKDEAGDFGHNVQRSEKIFAALDLVRHIGTSVEANDPFQSLLHNHLGSPVWSIRQHAARVLAARMTTNNVLQLILQQLAATTELTQNKTHGLLLFYRYVSPIEETQAIHGVLQSLKQLVQLMSEKIQSQKASPFVQGALLDIINDALRFVVIREMRAAQIVKLMEKLLLGMPTTHTYVRQRAILCATLSSLLDVDECRPQTGGTAIGGPTGVSATDAIFVAEELGEMAPLLQSSRQQTRLCSVLIDLAEDIEVVLPQLLMSIATSLETHELALTLADSNRLEHCSTKKTSGGDRDLWNAQLRLRAHILKSRIKAELTSPSVMESVLPWLHDIGTAKSDALEFPTRLNAAQALLVFASGCSNDFKKTMQEYDSAHIQFLLTVYDQLNDDDDEIRQVAQHTANAILSEEQSRISIRPCAVSARRSLIDVIIGFFNQSPTLPLLAIGRIVGYRNSVYHKAHFLDKSVEKRLSDIVSAMNDLFAEEKQNLYIDELDEIRNWTRVLASSSTNAISMPLWQSTVSWIVEGLTALRKAFFLDQETQSGGNGLGLTYNTEVLELSLRVIYLAKALMRLNVELGVHIRTRETVWRTGIAEELVSLAAVLRTTGAHPSLVRAASDE